MPTKITPPVVVDLGKTTRADIARLRKGAGRLVEDVEEVMRLVRSGLDSQDENRIFFPVVVIYAKD